MVDFVVTPPYVIPIAIALAVLAVATFKAPEKAPDLYRVTIDLPKATYLDCVTFRKNLFLSMA